MNLQEISDVFSVFHDGTPQDWKIKDGNLTLRISCLYLAELVSAEFEFFNLEVLNIKNFEYKPWEPFDINHSQLTTEEQLNKCDFEIITSKLREDRIEIICHEHSDFFGTPGGDILLSASGVTISAEDRRNITRKELLDISTAYWDKFGKKKE